MSKAAQQGCNDCTNSEVMMDKTFTSLLETICLLGGKTEKTKEESVSYNEFLRYAGSLARLNTVAVNAEIMRREEEEYGRQAEGHSSSRS